MIKTNELRIGNFFIYRINAENKICQIEGLNNEYVQLRVVNPLDFLEDEIPIDRCQPIPLTPEWLERCGQKCTNANGWDYQIQVGALKWYFRWNTEWYSEIGGIYIDSRVRYVHELQNLYFAISGKELPITSPLP